MPNTLLRKRVQREAYRLVLWQLAGVMMLALLTLLLRGKTVGFSVLAGGMAYGLPNLIFVLFVFRWVGAKQMTQFLAAFFIGEVMKLFLSGVLILLIVQSLAVSLLSVLTGFIAAITLFWIACIVTFSKQRSIN